MFSIDKQIYRYKKDGYLAQIEHCQLKTKTTKIILKWKTNYGILPNITLVRDDYIVLETRRGMIYVFDGKLVNMQTKKRSCFVDNFRFQSNKYLVSGISYYECPVLRINDIRTGHSLMVKCLKFDCFSIELSPNEENALVWVIYVKYKYTCIIPTTVFMTLLPTPNLNFKEYSINAKASRGWLWLNNIIIYQFLEPKIPYSHNENRNIQFYNIHTKRTHIIYDVQCSIPYLINDLIYLFSDDKIMIINCITYKEKEIYNHYGIKHYNRALDVFINANLDLYVLRNGDFIRFQFVGDYERDSLIIPQNIGIIFDCLLVCGIVYDIANEIYKQLLNIDPIVGLIY